MQVLPRFDVQGQVALVTGAARGLGRAIALARPGTSSCPSSQDAVRPSAAAQVVAGRPGRPARR